MPKTNEVGSGTAVKFNTTLLPTCPQANVPKLGFQPGVITLIELNKLPEVVPEPEFVNTTHELLAVNAELLLKLKFEVAPLIAKFPPVTLT